MSFTLNRFHSDAIIGKHHDSERHDGQIACQKLRSNWSEWCFFWGVKWLAAMKKKPGRLGYVGDYTTQFYRDYKDPYKPISKMLMFLHPGALEAKVQFKRRGTMLTACQWRGWWLVDLMERWSWIQWKKMKKKTWQENMQSPLKIARTNFRKKKKSQQLRLRNFWM